MKHIVDALAAQGRNGDTELLHISKSELDGIRSLAQQTFGRELPRNPTTGLYEASWFTKLRDGAESIGALAGNYFLPGSSILTSHLTSKDSQKDLNSPLGQIAQMGTGIGGGLEGNVANWTGGADAAQAGAPAAGATTPPTSGGPSSLPAGGMTATGDSSAASLGVGSTPPSAAPPVTPDGHWYDSSVQWAKDNPLSSASLGIAGAGIVSSALSPTPKPETHQVKVADASGLRVAPGAGGAGVYQTKAPLTLTQAGPGYGITDFTAGIPTGTPTFARGGMASLPMAPTMLRGHGDGMSDSIPAQIQSQRGQSNEPIRVANNEYIVPADVVSHLGNGSSDAGAKFLDKKMAQIRKARTGNPKQGKQIKPEKLL